MVVICALEIAENPGEGSHRNPPMLRTGGDRVTKHEQSPHPNKKKKAVQPLGRPSTDLPTQLTP
jgi:hypothetical protein